MDETKPLINNHDGNNSTEKTKYSKRDICQFVSIVLSTICYSSGLFLSFNLSTQYIYNRVAKEHSLNASDVSTAESPCLSSNISANKSEELNSIQSVSSQWNLINSISYSIPCVCINLFLGAHTDSFGRKPYIIISTVGGLIRALVAFATIWWDLPLYAISIGSFIEGASGSIYMFFVASLSSIADLTQPGKERTFAIAVIQGTSGTVSGLILIGSGYFIRDTGFFYPGMTIPLIFILSLLTESIFVKETLKKHKDVLSLKQRLRSLISLYTDNSKHRRVYIICIMTFFLQGVCFIGRIALITLYALNEPFCFTTIQIGFLNSATFLFPEFGGLLFLKLLQRWFPDKVVVVFSILSAAGSMVFQALATMKYHLYLVPVVGMLGLLVFPLLRGIMSRITDPKHQGALFGSIGAVEPLASVCSSLFLNLIYQKTVHVYPGAVFFVIVGLYGVMLLLFLNVVCQKTPPVKILEKSDDEFDNNLTLKG